MERNEGLAQAEVCDLRMSRWNTETGFRGHRADIRTHPIRTWTVHRQLEVLVQACSGEQDKADAYPKRRVNGPVD